MKLCLALTVVSLVTGGTSALQGSCRKARKCCDGKDSDCVVQKADINTIILDMEDEPCYCDHNCLNMGDCCPDFKDYCGVIDCQVSAWTAWSPCSSPCGLGKATRSRKILRPESNGGVSCPDLSQKKACKGSRLSPQCSRDATSSDSGHHSHGSEALRETGMLLPGKYSEVRKVHKEKYEVRANLKSFVPEEENRDRYCVVFKVDKAMKACSRSEDTEALRRGSTVCVSCETKASRPHLGDRCSGHGVHGKVTRFKNVITPGCHGRWTRVEVTDSCPCVSGPDFIFV